MEITDSDIKHGLKKLFADIQGQGDLAKAGRSHPAYIAKKINAVKLKES